MKHPRYKNKLIIDEEASKNVVEIFEGIINGKTPQEIANELNENEILTPALYKRKDETKNNDTNMNKKWDAKMINKILKDRIYVGDLIQGKRKVENYRTHKLVNIKEDEWIITQNHHEQIITEDKFNEVQEMLKKNKCARSNKEKDIFYGFLRCFDCGDSCTLRKSKDKEYYYCTSYVRSSSCTNHSIRKDKLIEKASQELNTKFIKKKIKTITRDVLMKNIEEIIIYENKEIKVKFK